MGDDWLQVIIRELHEDIAEIKHDIKTLQRFKWRVDGALMIVSALVSAIVSVTVTYFKLKT